MEKPDKKIIIEDLESRLSKLPQWQKTATIECIEILENREPSDKDMYINLRNAGHFDLADLFLTPEEKKKAHKKVKNYEDQIKNQ